MYKLLLVDDFFIEREKVKEIVAESELEIEIIGECSNGKQAIAVLEQQKPDFILSDIEMPIMNGLELGEVVRRKYPNIKTILFSYHDKFEYAKKAIDIEAYAYVLKPIIKDELILALQKIIEEREKDISKNKEKEELKELLNKSKPLIIEKFKIDLFRGKYKREKDIWERMKYFELVMIKELFMVLAIEVDNYNNLAMIKSYEEQELLWMNINKTIRERTENITSLWVRLDDKHWVILIAYHEDKIDDIYEEIYALGDLIIEELYKSEISISIGISQWSNNIVDINQLYEQAIYALQFKFNLGKRQIINYEDIQDISRSEDIELGNIQKEIKKVLISGSEMQGKQYINKMFEQLNPNISETNMKNLCFSVVMCIQITLNELYITFEDIFGKEELIWEKLIRFETIQDVKMWLKNSMLFIIRHINEQKNGRSTNLIDETKKYINLNYQYAITVKSIANDLYYNANYLNNIFKQETGETILEYITNVRIQSAKQLLTNNLDLKIHEISKVIGYKNESYFRSIFKRYTGLTPKEYRSTILANMKF